MKKTDLILAAIVLVAAAAIWLFYSAGADAGLGASITVDGEEVGFLYLNENDSFHVHTEDGYNIVTVQDGQVFVTEADCRDQICVEHKKVDKVGETIVCLPHKMVVEITGDGAEAFDMVVG